MPTHGGEVILTFTYGFADNEHGVPISPAPRFELASALAGQRTWLRSGI